MPESDPTEKVTLPPMTRDVADALLDAVECEIPTRAEANRDWKGERIDTDAVALDAVIPAMEQGRDLLRSALQGEGGDRPISETGEFPDWLEEAIGLLRSSEEHDENCGIPHPADPDQSSRCTCGLGSRVQRAEDILAEKFDALVAPQQDQGGSGVGAGLAAEERAFVLKRLKGDKFVTDILAQKRADRTPIDQDYPGDEEAEARAAYRKVVPGVLADLDALCFPATPPPALSEQDDDEMATCELCSQQLPVECSITTPSESTICGGCFVGDGRLLSEQGEAGK